MADTVRKARYFKTTIRNRPGEGAKVLDALRAAGVNLLAFHAFPRGRRAQIDLVPDDPAGFERVAKQAGLELERPKTCFVVQGDADRPGALAAHLAKLAAAEINVTAATGLASGAGRWGALVWVDSGDVTRAGRVLGAV
jgi:hypothetical protein